MKDTLIGYKDEKKVVALGEIIDDIKSDYKSSNKTINIVWPGRNAFLHTKIECRPLQIETALRYIIDNGIDAVTESGHDGIVSVEVKLIEKDNYVSIRIEDNGVEMPSKIRHNVFDNPLFTTKEYKGGTGLGLIMCKKIIDSHGGSILFNSDNGLKIFTIKLPLKFKGDKSDAY